MKDIELINDIYDNIEEEYMISNMEHIFFLELINYIKNNNIKLDIDNYKEFKQFPPCFLNYKETINYRFYINTTYHPVNDSSNCIGFYRYKLVAKTKASGESIDIVYIDIDIKGDYFTKDSYIMENKIKLFSDICSEFISN